VVDIINLLDKKTREVSMNYLEKLSGAIHRNQSFVCVGLDPDPSLMPEGISVIDFNLAIIRATADLVCAYKPNFAFYEAFGIDGLIALKETIKNIPSYIPVIADAKRSDIGNTAKAYARSIFENYGFDACTVNATLGFDSVEPFIQYQEKGVYLLCRTSNKGAADFQSLQVITENGTKLFFEVVAEKANSWNKHGNIGLVVGATFPEELTAVRKNYPEMPFLIPGVGAQGGDLITTVRNGLDKNRERTVINSSRQILYASRGKDFAETARKAARIMRDQINAVLTGK
jgi:orotidine-5'-phosphate decarboxylase